MDKITDISGNNVVTSTQTCTFYCGLQVIYSIQIQKYKMFYFLVGHTRSKRFEKIVHQNKTEKTISWKSS